MLDATPAQADPGRVTEANPTRPDPEVPERAHRRTFTARYKLDVLAAYDAADPGEKGAILRREGLYLSLIHISEPTRLGMISYAVFCLKKKKKKKTKKKQK